MAKALYREGKLFDIGDAIRDQLGVTTRFLPEQMAGAVLSITDGGASQSFTPHAPGDEVLIDEAHMTALGNAIRRKLGVTTLYLTEQMAAAIRSIAPTPTPTGDTKACLSLSSSLTQTIYFTMSAAVGVTVDWGDGSATETPTGTAVTISGETAYKVSLSHTYAAAGDYTVSLTAASGVTWSPGETIDILGKNFLGAQSTKSDSSPQLTAFIFGDGCTGINACAFYGCTSLESMTIPEGVTKIGTKAFADCTSSVRRNSTCYDNGG